MAKKINKAEAKPAKKSEKKNATAKAAKTVKTAKTAKTEKAEKKSAEDSRPYIALPGNATLSRSIRRSSMPDRQSVASFRAAAPGM